MKSIPNAIILGLFLAIGGLSQSLENSKRSELPDPKLRPPPKVEVDVQFDSPLRVTASTEWVKMTPDGISLNIKVENVSARAIRAYTTWNRISRDESARGCFLLNVIKPGKVLQPGQSELRTTWRSYPQKSPTPLHLSVDFIEFTDDSVWGLDTCQSAETLAGTRAGARFVTERLQKIFAEGGPRAVVRALDSIVEEIEIPPEKSPVWKQGFLAGLKHMLVRVRQFIADSGLIEVEAALKQPYDASGYKIDVVLPEPENQ